MKHILIKAARIIAVLFASAIFIISCKKESGSGTPMPNNIEPGEGSANEVLTLTGSGLSGIQSIVFETGNVPAPFNPVFNTDNAILFRVPDTALGGPQNIVFTKTDSSQFTVPFTVIALPSITTVFPTDFQAGTIVTFTGSNFESVNKVILEGTSDEAEIVSMDHHNLVVKMPASTTPSAPLVVYNEFGSSVTQEVFVNVDVAFGIFKDNFGPLVENWSWSVDLSPSPDNVVTGTSSMLSAYNGAWGGIQLHMSSPVNLADYNYVSFWIKGGSVDKIIDFYMNWGNMKKLDIPANGWQYFKFPVLEYINSGITSLEFFIMQIEGDPETFYMDNIILSK